MRHHRVLRSNIKAELARADIRGKDAAAAIGITPAVFSSRLHGRSDWQVRELVALADVLQVPVDRLLAGVSGKRTILEDGGL